LIAVSCTQEYLRLAEYLYPGYIYIFCRSRSCAEYRLWQAGTPWLSSHRASISSFATQCRGSVSSQDTAHWYYYN